MKLREIIDPEQPAFEHDCDRCVFVGSDHPQQNEPRVNQIDMYVHRSPSHVSLIRRYGSEPAHYASQEWSDHLSPKFQRVLNAARGSGLIEAGGMTMREAIAPDALRQQRLYHGTSDEVNGEGILNQGIQPGNQNQKARGHMTPVLGRSYLTPTLSYGIIYCIGGDMLGCSEDSAQYLANRKSRHGRASRYGWLFVVEGQQLVDDVQPDEDSIGEFLSHHTEWKWDQSTKPRRRLPPVYKPDGTEDAHKRLVWHNIRSAMTERQFYRAIDGEYSAWASGGKRALQYLSDHDKLSLIRWGAHVAYRGVLVPDQAWRFDKLMTPQLTHDGSNFFSLAERIR